MGVPCKRNLARLCSGCGECEPAPEYELRCDNCKDEIENLDICLMIGDYAYCQKCVDDGWAQWHKTNESAGWRLCRMRKQKNLTQEELADRLGVTKGAIGHWERGISFVPRGKVAAIRKEVGDDF